MFKSCIFFIFLLLTVVGCSSSIKLSYPSHLQIAKFVHIDPTFDKIDREDINKSLNEWEIKSKGLVKWNRQPWISTIEAESHSNDPDCLNHLYIIDSSKNDKKIKDLESKIGFRLRGYLQASDHQCGVEYAFIVRDRIYARYIFRLIVLHEVGHSLLLQHNTNHSVMNSPILDILDGLTSYDINYLFRIWNYKPSATAMVIPEKT